MEKLINDHPLLKTTVVLVPDLDRSATFNVNKITDLGNANVKIHLEYVQGRWGNTGMNVAVVLPSNFTKEQLERCDVELIPDY